MNPKIKISRGRTINIGNYESERIDISVEVEPLDNSSMEVEKTYKKALHWVLVHLEEQSKAIQKQLTT